MNFAVLIMPLESVHGLRQREVPQVGVVWDVVEMTEDE